MELINNIVKRVNESPKDLFTKEDIIKILTETSRPSIKSGGVIIDPESYTIIANGGEHIAPKKIFELTYYLMANKNKMMDRESILKNVWGTDIIVGHRTIDVHIRKIRMIAGDYIKTFKSKGYAWMEN